MINERIEHGETHPARFPIARVDLEEEVRRMRASPTSSDHLGKTVMHAPDLRLVLMTLKAGTRIPEHCAEGSLTIHALDGRILVEVVDATFDLAPNQMLALERGLSYALHAIEDTAILLSISWPA
jgi:quercetin dioxygenase-like cupin family protein